MKDYEKFYYEYISELRDKHEANVSRIRLGIRINLILPLAFLILSFTIGGSRFIFLMLWIVSLFGIAAYLIFVEYTDFELQQKLIDLEDREDGEPESLIEGKYLEPHLESLQEKVGYIAEAKNRKMEQLVEVKNKAIGRKGKKTAEREQEKEVLVTVDEVISSREDQKNSLREKSGAAEEKDGGAKGQKNGQTKEKAPTKEESHA
ncbi:hypothetical protein HMPREF1508_1795 [Shuttleworthella sp. MSX8B]|uniref:hypothetical protein n=1 Tax=Shuttleworthella sp. MSX8B TaxID=936574 RepID=UPI00044C7AFD|nr:hypothetical protein [Shuttleworthia sp. MSX8B]EUB12668.1 hypothetical protein HMPREF1508_1795 [Shuttleworthia sp. MSX8B]